MYIEKNKTIFVLFRTWNNKKVLFEKGFEPNKNKKDFTSCLIFSKRILTEN